jgi:hypothetical protein
MSGVSLRLGMALKASNAMGNPVTLHRIWCILIVRRIDDLVLGTPGNRLCLWPSTSKQGSGVGHTLNAPLCLWPLTSKQGSRVGHTLNATLALGWSL